MLESDNRENLKSCPVCFSDNFSFLYSKKDAKLEIADSRVWCKDCGVVFIQNRLMPQFIIQKFYQQRNPIGDTEKYLKKKAYLRRVVNLAVKLLPKGANVFDIGCGGGALLKFLKDKGYKVSGLEVGEQAREEAERVVGIKGSVAVGDFLDFISSGVDAVFMTDVIEHLHNPHIYLKKASEILKPGGLLVIRTPNSGSFMHKLLKARWMLASPRHITLYGKKSLLYLLKKNNFRVVYFEAEKKPVGKFIPPFSYGLAQFIKGSLINVLKWFFAATGKGESITVIARKIE